MKTDKKINLLQKNLWVCLLALMMFQCSDLVDVDPPTNKIVSEVVFTDDATAISAMMGIYSQMNRSGIFSVSGTTLNILTGLSSDEFIGVSTSSSQTQYTFNKLDAGNTFLYSSLWQSAYSLINYTNAMFDGLETQSGVTAETKNQLIGEAKFVRGMCYFHLVNLFGDVPLILTRDWETDRLASRAPVSEVYTQIIADLEDAFNRLPGDYEITGGERVRVNKYVAAAALAKVHLQKGDWTEAEQYATMVINNNQYALPTDITKVFLKGSSEAIWQIKSVDPNVKNSTHTIYFANALSGSNPLYYLTDELYNSFDASDLRLTNWVGTVVIGGTLTYRFPYKYKALNTAPTTEYDILFRLAEQYLIRAEVRAHLGTIAGAQADINAIRNRAGLGDTTASTMETLLDAIEKERKWEFFSEGMRWYDLKRMNKATEILGPISYKDWQATDVLYPIPQREREADPNLTQNPGYN